MAEPQSPDYKKLYFEARRRREAAEQKLRGTTLLEYLDACHTYLHSGLSVRSNPTMTTQGDPANADKKLRPEKLVEWEGFPEEQANIWADLMESDFATERHFKSLIVLEALGRDISDRKMGSEQDLHDFLRSTVESPVTSIIKTLYGQPMLRDAFNLKGTVQFDNHANTLSPETELEAGIESMTLSHANTSARSSRPRADQFCVYNTSIDNEEIRVAAYSTEFKPPYKLTLGCIYEGLEDMQLDEVIQRHESETPRDRFRRLMGAVITQAFSYMIKLGVEYGCVCTGEATVFLRVPDDPTTVQYFLSVPHEDVGVATGWLPNSDGPNRLHLTAVGQMLAFTLQALKTPPRSQQWRDEAESRLNRWEAVVDDLLEAVKNDAPSSVYRPSRHNKFLRMSPVRHRRAKGSPLSFIPQYNQHTDSEEEPDPDTPSRRQPSSQSFSRVLTTRGSSASQRSRRGQSGQSGQSRQSGQYCTHNCLLGLVNGGPLDMSCPNVRDHGHKHHPIDQRTFLTYIREQLSSDLDTDCEPVSLPGACGVLFRVRLKSHGYAVAAKCTPIHFVHRLQHEAAVYDVLRSIQGIHVPVHLGNIDLVKPYRYEGICKLVHMMFLSFGGERISQCMTARNRPLIIKEANHSAQAIHDLGVLHNDLEPRNILWNEETSQVMVIDFERAKIVEPQRIALGVVSANRKRKREAGPSTLKRLGEEQA